MDILSTVEIPKAIQIPPKSRQLIRQRCVFTDRTSVPKIKEHIIGDHFPRKSSAIMTSPFSSEEEFDNEDLIQACTSPNLFPVESSKGKSNFGRNSIKSDTDWTEGSKIENSDISPKPTGTSIKTLTENVEKMVSHHRNVNKPAGGITVAEAFLKGELKEELKCGEGGDDDWDISLLEEIKSLGEKSWGRTERISNCEK